MARMTKAEKLAELQQRCDAYEAKREATYRPRLMAALELATSGRMAMELTVQQGLFKLSDRAEWGQVFTLPAFYVKPDMFDNMRLDDLESFLEKQEDERVEAARKNTVRASALGKLTKEEKELLNLQ
jgi:hypothetical protein